MDEQINKKPIKIYLGNQLIYSKTENLKEDESIPNEMIYGSMFNIPNLVKHKKIVKIIQNGKVILDDISSENMVFGSSNIPPIQNMLNTPIIKKIPKKIFYGGKEIPVNPEDFE